MKAGGLEEGFQHLRSKATELLLREDWKEYMNLYTHFISLCQDHLLKNPNSSSNLHKSLSSALSNRADARFRLKDLSGALKDCNSVLKIDPNQFKTLVCKGKVLLDLDRYSRAAECFQLALALNSNSESLRGLLDQCKKLDAQSRTGAIDVTDWVLSGFNGKLPDLAEFAGPVEVRKSENGKRGLFVTKSVEAGTPLVVTKAVVIRRGIFPESGNGSGDNGRMVMWKDFVDRILKATEKCSRTLHLIYTLSTGDGDDVDGRSLRVPDMRIFWPEIEEEFSLENREPDVERILKVLDVNCLTEEAVSAKVLGKQMSGYCGIGLWILPSFVNHSCNPNVRRLHIGDWMVIHASRDLKAGEEMTLAYFDVLLPLSKRRELSKRWGFHCKCKRCTFEENEEVKEMENDLVVRVEEEMKKKMMGKKEKGFLRASFWAAYSEVYESEKLMKKWGRRIPPELLVVESIMDAVGGDERVLAAAMGRLRKLGSIEGVEMERMMKMGRRVYGKVVRKKGMKALLESCTANTTC